MSFELRDIEYFAVVAEHRNVTRASEALGLTPTALSKCLRRLEKSADAKIVKRTPKGVELTAVGSALLAQVQRVRLTLEDVAREVADLSKGRAGHLRIGAGPTVCEELPRVYAALRSEAPNVTIEITVSDNDVTVPQLLNGELDLVFNDFFRTYEGTRQEYLYDDEFVVCASASHRLARPKRVTVANLANEQWVLAGRNLTPQQHLNKAFQERGLPTPRIAVKTRSWIVRLGIVAATDLLTYSTRRIIRENAVRFSLKELPVKELLLRRRIGVLYREDAYLSPATLRFIEILKAIAKRFARDQ